MRDYTPCCYQHPGVQTQLDTRFLPPSTALSLRGSPPDGGGGGGEAVEGVAVCGVRGVRGGAGERGGVGSVSRPAARYPSRTLGTGCLFGRAECCSKVFQVVRVVF